MKPCMTHLLLSLFFTSPCFADTLPTTTQAQVMNLLQKYGTPVQKSNELFPAADACHMKSLSSIVYYMEPALPQITFLFNDELGNCNLAHFSFDSIPPHATLCVVSDSAYKAIFTPWFRDAVKQFDINKQANPAFVQFMNAIGACLKPTSPEAILSMMRTSNQVQFGLHT